MHGSATIGMAAISVPNARQSRSSIRGFRIGNAWRFRRKVSVTDLLALRRNLHFEYGFRLHYHTSAYNRCFNNSIINNTYSQFPLDNV
jgi:hypothetical protein